MIAYRVQGIDNCLVVSDVFDQKYTQGLHFCPKNSIQKWLRISMWNYKIDVGGDCSNSEILECNNYYLETWEIPDTLETIITATFEGNTKEEYFLEDKSKAILISREKITSCDDWSLVFPRQST